MDSAFQKLVTETTNQVVKSYGHSPTIQNLVHFFEEECNASTDAALVKSVVKYFEGSGNYYRVAFIK